MSLPSSIRKKTILYSVAGIAVFILLGFQLVIYQQDILLDYWAGRSRHVTKVLGITTSDKTEDTWISLESGGKDLPDSLESMSKWHVEHRSCRTLFREENVPGVARIERYGILYIGRVLNRIVPPARKLVANYWLGLHSRPRLHDLSKEVLSYGLAFRYSVALVTAIQSSPPDARFDEKWITTFNERYTEDLDQPFSPKHVQF